MSDKTLERTPDVIATEINWIKVTTRDVLLHSSVEIGRRLVEVKALVPHGEWMDWLQENVDYSQSTANNLMKLYQEYGDRSQALGNLTYTKALALLGVSEDERERFVQENDVESLSSREIQQLVKEQKDLQKRLKAAEEAKTKLEAETSRLQSRIELAKQQGDEAEVKRLQTRVKDLESELENKPIDVPGVVEKIPDAVQMELEQLRKQVTQSTGAASIKFRIQFDNLAKGFQDLLLLLAEVQSESPEEHDKYKRAVSGLTNKMLERLV